MSATQQRQVFTRQGITGTQGTCQIIFEPPSAGYVLKGTVSVIDGPITETWTLKYGVTAGGVLGAVALGQQVLTTVGSTPIYDVQVLDNEVMFLEGVGLTPGQVYTASFIGVLDSSDKVDLDAPKASTQAVNISGGTINADLTGPVEIDGTVTVTPEAGSTFEVNAGDVQVENVGGTFLLTGDIPSVPIGCTLSGGGLTATTTTAMPAGMRALVINPAGTNGQCYVNVVGTTSNIRYAWQALLGQYAPLVIPIDPDTDTYYQINIAGGTSFQSAPLLYAFAQPPNIPEPITQTYNVDLISYTGTTKETMIPISGIGSDTAIIQSISWTAFGSSASSAALGHIYANMIAGSVYSAIAGILATSSGLSGIIEFPNGLPIYVGSPAINLGIWFAGNSGSTDFSNVDIVTQFYTL